MFNCNVGGGKRETRKKSAVLWCAAITCLCLMSPRLALGFMGYFQNNTNEPVVILGFAT